MTSAMMSVTRTPRKENSPTEVDTAIRTIKIPNRPRGELGVDGQ